MNQKELIELGLSEDQAKKVLELHKTTLDGKYEPKERNQQLREKVKELEQTIAEKDKVIEESSKANKSVEELETKIRELEEQSKQKDQENAKKISEMQMNTALKSALAGKVHDVALTMTLFDTSKIKLNDDGAITEGFDEQLEALAKEKAYLFKQDEPPAPGVKLFGKGAGGQGGGTFTPPEENKGVEYARAAAKRKQEAVQNSKKAADAFFGGKK